MAEDVPGRIEMAWGSLRKRISTLGTQRTVPPINQEIKIPGEVVAHNINVSGGASPADLEAIKIDGDQMEITGEVIEHPFTVKAPDEDLMGIKIVEDEQPGSYDALEDAEVKNEVVRVQKEVPLNNKTVGEVDSRNEFERLVVDGTVLDEATKFMREVPNSESGGVLVGQFCTDKVGKNFTIVRGFIPNNRTNDWGGVQFTNDSWTKILGELDNRNNALPVDDKDVVIGWVHSHPAQVVLEPRSEGENAFGDRLIMRHYFSEPRVTMIYGNGGEFDNQYTVWRNVNGKAVLQTGFEVSNSRPESSYGYCTNVKDVDL